MLKKHFYMLLSLAFSLTLNTSKAQDQSIQRTFQLAAQAKSYYEGFQKNIGKNEFSYQSLRDDVTSGLLTRTAR